MTESKKYDIRHICPSFNNPLYTSLIEEQIKLGNLIRVFYFRQKKTGLPNGDKPYVDGATPFTYLDRFFFGIKENKVYNSYKNIYQKKKIPDCIHAHTLFTAGYIAYKEKKKKGIPYVVAVRGTDVNLFFKKRIFLRNVGIKILTEANAIIFISDAHKKEVLSKYVPLQKKESIEKKSYVIPNGIDDFWHLHHQEKMVNTTSKLHLIYYGDIDRNKNVDITIQALEKLKDKYDVVFTVIGKIKEKKYEKMLISNNRCKYYDFMKKEELIDYLREGDIFIMPSFSETFGLTYVEAMSQGLPIIYSKGQGIDGMFDEGYVGYHVNPRSADEVCNAIDMIMRNYKAISNHCLESSQFFTWSKIAQLYQDLYDKVL